MWARQQQDDCEASSFTPRTKCSSGPGSGRAAAEVSTLPMLRARRARAPDAISAAYSRRYGVLRPTKSLPWPLMMSNDPFEESYFAVSW